MLRRSFLLFLPAFILAIFGIDKAQLSRDELITNYLKTPNGKKALAESMMRPIRDRIDYTGMSRKVLLPNTGPMTIQDLHDTLKESENA